MNWAPAAACFWVAEPWASFECWVSFGMMGCRWVEALEQLGGAGGCLWVGWAPALPAWGLTCLVSCSVPRCWMAS